MSEPCLACSLLPCLSHLLASAVGLPLACIILALYPGSQCCKGIADLVA